MDAMVNPATPSIPPGEHIATADQRVAMHRLSWDQFETLLTMRGESSRPRVAYLDGELELMSPSNDHEAEKTMIGAIVEHYCLERDIPIKGIGSWTLKQEEELAGAEPDECYVFRHDLNIQRFPDLVIEVVWTSGGIDKLEIYRRLKIGEVWFWKDDAITVYVLGEQGYEVHDKSGCLPELDLALVCTLARCESLNEAVKQLRAALGR